MDQKMRAEGKLSWVHPVIDEPYNPKQGNNPKQDKLSQH